MADPAGAHVLHAAHAGHMFAGVAQQGGKLRLRAIERPHEDGPRRLPDDAEDHQRDDATDDGVGQRETQPDADGARHDGEARQPVDPRVVAVGDQRRAVDLATHADAEGRHGLVAEEADHAGCRHGGGQADGLRMDQALDRFVAGHERAEQDHGDDGHAGEVLDAPETVGELVAGFATGEQEGDPQRYRRGRIADVVDRVGEQRHAAGNHDHRHLQDRGDRQDREGPLDGPDAARGRRNRRVDHAVGVGMTLRVVMALPTEAQPVQHRVQHPSLPGSAPGYSVLVRARGFRSL